MIAVALASALTAGAAEPSSAQRGAIRPRLFLTMRSLGLATISKLRPGTSRALRWRRAR
jgi:hypothetical protein